MTLQPMGDNLVTANGKFEYTPTGLILHGVPTKDEWLAAFAELSAFGEELDVVTDMWRWNVGDMLVNGEMLFNEEAFQAVGWQKEQTFRNAMTVCRQITKERRRHPNVVRFWTHYELIGLPPHKQDEILALAAEQSLTKMEVREQKRLAKGDKAPARYTASGKGAYKDMRGNDHVLIIPYWPDTESGVLSKGHVQITIKEV